MSLIREDDLLYAPLFALLAVLHVVFLAFMSTRLMNLITSFRVYYLGGTVGRVRGLPKAGLVEAGKEPHVTVIISSFNEGAVVPKTIACACSMDWPRDKLTVLVADDSTDKKSRDLIDSEIALWRDLQVRRLKRPNRTGYKAGCLSYHFGEIEGDYVAFFDADHRPEPDLLRKSMPYFFDSEGNPKKAALVQTPWAYYNISQNLLTECDSFALDHHHVVEQVARAINCGICVFNGTGGIWNKKAIEDGGGFTWETVTEDLFLSYRLYIEQLGYEYIYLHEIPQSLELPPDILSHIQQKHRWTKGNVQTSRILGGAFLSSPKVPLVTKVEFFAQTLASLQCVTNLFMQILMVHLDVTSLMNTWQYQMFCSVAGLEFTLSAAHSLFSKVPARDGHYSTRLSQLSRFVRFFVPFCFLHTGRTVFEFKSFLEGLLSSDATFLTTPKQGAPTTVHHFKVDDIAAFSGLAIALHQIIFSILNDPYGGLENEAHRESMRFWSAHYTVGLICVPAAFLFAKHKHLKKQFSVYMNSPSGQSVYFGGIVIGVFAALLYLFSV